MQHDVVRLAAGRPALVLVASPGRACLPAMGSDPVEISSHGADTTKISALELPAFRGILLLAAVIVAANPAANLMRLASAAIWVKMVEIRVAKLSDAALNGAEWRDRLVGVVILYHFVHGGLGDLLFSDFAESENTQGDNRLDGICFPMSLA